MMTGTGLDSRCSDRQKYNVRSTARENEERRWSKNRKEWVGSHPEHPNTLPVVRFHAKGSAPEDQWLRNHHSDLYDQALEMHAKCVMGRPIHQESDVLYKLQLAMLRSVEEVVPGTFMDEMHPAQGRGFEPLPAMPFSDIGGYGFPDDAGCNAPLPCAVSPLYSAILDNSCLADITEEGVFGQEEVCGEDGSPEEQLPLENNPALAFYYQTMLVTPPSTPDGSSVAEEEAGMGDDADDELLLLRPGVL